MSVTLARHAGAGVRQWRRVRVLEGTWPPTPYWMVHASLRPFVLFVGRRPHGADRGFATPGIGWRCGYDFSRDAMALTVTVGLREIGICWTFSVISPWTCYRFARGRWRLARAKR